MNDEFGYIYFKRKSFFFACKRIDIKFIIKESLERLKINIEKTEKLRNNWVKVKIIQKLFARNKRFCNSISISIINQRNIISTSNKLTIKIFHLMKL